MQDINFKKIFLVTMVISLVISALIGIIVFLLGEFGTTETKLLLTTLIIGIYSLTGLCSASLYEKMKFLPFALFGIVISVMGFFITLLTIWNAIGLKNIWKMVIILIILAASSAHISLLLLIDSENVLVNGSLLSTFIAIMFVALMLIIAVLNNFEDTGEFYFRIVGVFAILDVIGTIVTPILNKFYSIKN